MRFYGISMDNGLVSVPGPVSLPQLSMSDITIGTIDDGRLSANVVLADAVQTLINKTIDTADNAITVDQADVTGLTVALALKLDAATYTAADIITKIAGQAISWTNNHTWADNAVIRLGTGADLQLLHDGSDSFVRSGTGRLFVSGATGGGGGTAPSGFEATTDLAMLAAQSVFARGNSGSAGPNVDLLYYRSSFSSPTAPLNTHTLGQVRFRGHDSTAPRTTATIAGIANQDWSAGSAYGTDVRIQTTAAGATAAATRMTIGSAGTTLVGNLVLGTAGNQLQIKQGTNASAGVATLVAGTVTVNNTLVTANSMILPFGQNSSGTHGELTISARVAGTSFTITSSSATDTRSVAWLIIEPAP